MKITSSKFAKGIRGTDPITHEGAEQIVFVGRSNVGKSSLINSLTGNKKLAMTSNRAGKTTEINFFLINREFYFVDLPGYGYAKTNLKERDKLKRLILWYLSASDTHPRLVVLVIDINIGITNFDQQMIEILVENRHPFIIAANKADKLSKSEAIKQLALINESAAGGNIVMCSATAHGGSQELLQRIFA